MKSKINRFALFFAVALVSLGAILFASDMEGLKSFAQIPFAAGVIGALFQLVRDDAAHFRAQQLQETKLGFALGVESHMSKVAFDKHVAFCEEYGAEIHRTLGLLYQHGTRVAGMECAGRMFRLRVKHAVWLSDEIQNQLKPFEDTVKSIQISMDLVNALAGEEDQRAQRSKAIDKTYIALHTALGEESWQDQPLPSEGSFRGALEALKLVVGSEFLTVMRDQVRKSYREHGL